jgi:hypothetical protein
LAPAGIAPLAVPAVPTAHEAHERGNGHAATRQSVLARPVIAPYSRRVVDPPRLKFLSPRIQRQKQRVANYFKHPLIAYAA